jgi:dienelactone hydrolase
MKRMSRFGLFLAVALLAPALPAAVKLDLDRVTPVPDEQPIPIEDFFRAPAMTEPKLNLAGTHLASTIAIGEDRTRLFVHEFATKKDEYYGGVDRRNVYDFEWLDDSRLIFNVTTRNKYALGLMAANAGDLANSYPLLLYTGAVIVSIPNADRLHPLVWNRYDPLGEGMNLGVSAVDTENRGGRLIDELANRLDSPLMVDARRGNERHIARRFPEPLKFIAIDTRYVADREGRLAFAITTHKGERILMRLAGEEWIKCPVDLEEVDVLGAGDDPGQLLVLGPRQANQPRPLQLMEGATGKLGEVLLQDKAYDYNGSFRRDPGTNELLGTTFERNGPRSVWLNENYRNLQKILDGFFPGLVVRILDSNTAQNFFLVETFSDRQPVTYNWVDLEKRTAGVIKNTVPWLDPKRMRPVNIIRCKTRDGRELDAYLTLPAGASKEKPAPMIVLPPNSPTERQSWGFDRTAQYFASRGYAVLRPNYRGSIGYTWLFPREDEWDFRKASDDINDATKTVIASGLADPKRVAIVGTWFGGYLAVTGAVNEPDLYRCAASIDGVFDLERLLEETKYEKFSSAFFSYWLVKLGDPKKNREKFALMAPGRHADQIRAAVFLSVERDNYDDLVVQAKRLSSDLNKNNVPNELYMRTDILNDVSNVAQMVNIHSRLEAFLAKHLAPPN